MNNLTQAQKDAKQAYLNNQLEQMTARYEKADTGERNAIIGHIDSFISGETGESRIFWLKVRNRLERLKE